MGIDVCRFLEHFIGGQVVDLVVGNLGFQFKHLVLLLLFPFGKGFVEFPELVTCKLFLDIEAVYSVDFFLGVLLLLKLTLEGVLYP